MSELQDAIWRRFQAHREVGLAEHVGEDEGLLIPLVLSLARLAAQRDARAMLMLGMDDAG